MPVFKPISAPAVYRSIILLLLALSAVSAFADDSSKENKPAKLFESDANLEITLSADWRELIDNEANQDAYPATLEYSDPQGERHSHELTVERRGVKRQDACEFPPIRLRFDKEAVRDTMFRGQKSVKMVTHCRRSDRYDQYYILEMMAYEMYNVITDYSFRVRPLTVRYVNSGPGDFDETRFAFLIEDDSDVAKRNDLKKYTTDRLGPASLDPVTASDMALFQYMIGNVDWSPLIGPDPEECCHNVKLVAPRPLEQGDLIQPVPYDFDSSGLVNPPYAEPPDNLGIRSVTQRVYRGYCAHNGELENARRKALDRKTDILAVLDSDERLSDRSRKKAAKYLDKYFDILEDEKDFDRLIVRNCRK
ncbi:MAG: hypothetical protein PVI83_09680 [Lysobacterales bacterium]|jgi:hypothetical protein